MVARSCGNVVASLWVGWGGVRRIWSAHGPRRCICARAVYDLLDMCTWEANMNSQHELTTRPSSSTAGQVACTSCKLAVRRTHANGAGIEDHLERMRMRVKQGRAAHRSTHLRITGASAMHAQRHLGRWEVVVASRLELARSQRGWHKTLYMCTGPEGVAQDIVHGSRSQASQPECVSYT